MDYTLENFFPWNSNSNTQSFTLFLDSNSNNAEFAFITYLIGQIRANNSVIVLCTGKSKRHYEFVLRKNGIDVDSLQKQRRILLKEILVSISDFNAGAECWTWEQLSQWSAENLPVSSLSFGDFCKSTTDSTINTTPSSAPSTSIPFVLFIDDLESLEAMAPDNASARRLISSLLFYMHSPKQPDELHIYGLAVFGRSISRCGGAGRDDVELLYEADLLPVSEYCKYRADTTVEVRPLATGYSTDVHGTILISSRHTPEPSSSKTLSSQFGRSKFMTFNSTAGMAPTSSEVSGRALDEGTIWEQTLVYKALDSGVRCTSIQSKSQLTR